MSQIIYSGSACLAMLVVATAVTYAESTDENSSDGTNATSEVVDVKATIPELSVPPSTHIEFPENRPAWVGAAPELEGETHVWSVASTGGDTVADCQSDIKTLQRVAVELYIKHLTQSEGDVDYPINDDWIENELIAERYVGTCNIGDEARHEVAVRLEFGPEAQQKIKQSFRKLEVRDRLAALGGATFLGFLGLIGASMFLGFASRRVQKRQSERFQTAP